jgi:hypothetical protein
MYSDFEISQYIKVNFYISGQICGAGSAGKNNPLSSSFQPNSQRVGYYAAWMAAKWSRAN